MKPTFLPLLLLLSPQARAEAPLFSRQITPTLYRLGCSAGQCHGSFSGKGNFRLSLFAADPEADFRAIRYDGFARRVNRLRPEDSLLLLKPTGVLPHGGGVRLKRNGPEYQLLKRWIEGGMPFDSTAEGHIQSLRVEPTTVTLDATRPRQPLRVWARLSGGREEDVTRWARFESLNDDVARVDDAGHVTRQHSGDTPVLARYAGQVGFTTVIVPAPLPSGLKFPHESPADRVDQLLLARLRLLNIVPSPRCDDLDFVRRVYLDVSGTLPLPQEVRTFLADKTPDKRARLTDRLLAGPEHASLWALKLCDLIGADDRFGAPVYVWYDRLRDQLRRNVPWDKLVSLDYISGLKFNSGNDGMQKLDGRKVALQVAYAYLGMHLECAQCHKHPNDRWTQNDFFSFAQAFAYTAKKPPGKPVEIFRDVVTGQPLPPRILGGAVIDLKPGVSPRQEVMKWVVSKDNPYFARAIVNRVWAHYFGRGLIEPVDAQAAANPPIHPEVLDELARAFTASGFDLRQLHRRLLNTAAYQRTWKTNASNARDERNFSRRILRLLDAEVAVDAINQVTGAPLKVRPAYAKLPPKRVIKRALELPASRLSPADDGYLLRIFGKPLRVQASDYERSNTPSLSQVLYLYNSTELKDKIAADKGRLRQLLDAIKDDDKLIEELYLLTLTRLPRPEETARALDHVRTAASRRVGFQELLWSLCNHKEFLVNR